MNQQPQSLSFQKRVAQVRDRLAARQQHGELVPDSEEHHPPGVAEIGEAAWSSPQAARRTQVGQC